MTDPSLRHQIDQLCDEYEAGLKAGSSPQLDGLLDRVAADGRETLFRELLALQLEYQDETSETVNFSKLQDSYPDYTAIIDQLAAANTPTMAPTEPMQPAGPGVGTNLKYFGEYELLDEIARGGMGVVYRARQRGLNRVVALKMILAGQLAGPEDVARFKTEAEAAAQLDHWGIVPIYEIGEHEGRHYFSMAFVEGQSLQDKIRNGPMEPREAAQLVAKIAEAIGYAHEMGVIHRDLKPANILLDRDGTPKVTDFGLAKQVQSESGLTQTGAVMGTPSYMPPEQASGGTANVGPLADVYSLGAILYCLLTGRPPFQAANVLDTIKQVLEHDPIPPTDLTSNVPRDLETITLKCLEKNADRRYASAAGVGSDLQRYLSGQPIEAQPPTFGYRFEMAYRKHKSTIWGGILVATLILAGFVGTVLMWIQADLSEARATKAGNQAIMEAARTKVALKKTQRAEAAGLFQLANARWDANRVRESRQLLEEIPTEYRGNFEWHYCRRLFEGSDFTCYGHTKPVFGTAFSPEGGRIASGSSDGTIRVWDAATGLEMLMFKGHIGVFSVAFSPDGTRIVSGGIDDTIKVWGAKTGDELLTLKGTELALSVAFSRDGARIVSGHGDGTVRIWGSSAGEEILKLEHTGGITSVGFSPDGASVVSGSSDSTLQIWNATTGKEVRMLKGHTGGVNGVAFSPDGERIVSCSSDATLKIWDASTGQELLTLKGHTSSVQTVAFSPDGASIASGSLDNTLKIWDESTGVELRTLKGHTSQVLSVSLSPDGRRIVSGSKDNTLKVWEVPVSDGLLKGHSGPVKSVAFSRDGTRVASGSNDDEIRIWEASTGNELLVLRGHTDDVNSVAFSPNGRNIASASSDQTLKVWDTTTGNEVLTLNGHGDEVGTVAFNPDGTLIVSGSSDGGLGGDTLKVWDTTTGREVQSLRAHGLVTAVAFSPDGKRIGSGGWDKTLKVWDVATGSELLTFTGHAKFVTSLAFGPNGDFILSGSWDGKAKIWDAKTGSKIRSLDGHAGKVQSVAFGPDGTRIVSASENTVTLWNAARGSELLTLDGQIGPITAAVVSPAGTLIASGGWGNTVKLWSGRRGSEVTTLSGHTGEISSVSFSSDSTRIYSRASTGEEIVWNAETGQRLPDEEWSQVEKGIRTSADGRWLLVPSLSDVLIVDLEFKNTPDERMYREAKARLDPWWHDEQAANSAKAGDWYGATLHAAYLFKLRPKSQPVYDRLHAAHAKLALGKRSLLPRITKEALALPKPSGGPRMPYGNGLP